MSNKRSADLEGFAPATAASHAMNAAPGELVTIQPMSTSWLLCALSSLLHCMFSSLNSTDYRSLDLSPAIQPTASDKKYINSYVR